jgi:hypothetical protein
MQVTLGGLVNGELQVESIEIDNPAATLVRMQGNRVNWLFEPAVSLRNSAMLEKVRLDQITVNGGSVHLIDEVRAKRGEVRGLSATVSAPSLTGPWRSSGRFELNDAPLAFTLSTSVWNDSRPLRFGVRFSPDGEAGYSLSIEGERTGSGLKGQVRLEPVAGASGKGNSEGQFRAVTVKAGYVADFGRLELNDIEMRPSDTTDQGTLITGKASAGIGSKILVSADISAPRVDLDALAGAGSRRLLRDGGGLALINGLLASLPQDLELAARVKVQALRAGGEVLESAELAFNSGPDAVNIRHFSAGLPGRSKLAFSGVFFPGERFAELGGKLSIESFDTRQLAYWVVPESKANLARIWTGNRGRLKATSDVRLTASKLEFRNMLYELNGDSGSGRLAMLVNGERPILDVEIQTDRLDVDGFLPDGIGSLPSSGMHWSLLMQNFLTEQSRRDMRFVLDAKQLLLNGVDARGVAASLETTVQGVDVKRLSVTSVGGASLRASGVMLMTEAGVDGEISMQIAADDPRGLLRLAALVPRDHDPAWVRPLGRTDMKLVLRADPSDGAAFRLSANGSSGGFTIRVDGRFLEALTDRARFTADARIDGGSSAEMWKLLGGNPKTTGGPAAVTTLRLDGAAGAETKLVARTELQNVRFDYDGTLSLGLAGLAGTGGFSIESQDASGFMRMLGVPLVGAASPAVAIKSRVSLAEGGFALSAISGTASGGPVSGELKLTGSTLAGEIAVERISIAQGLALVFLPWDGQPASLQSLLAAKMPYGLTGELWFKSRLLDVYPGYTVPDGQLAISSKGSETQFVAYGKDQAGQKVSVELLLDARLAQRKVSGSIALPIRLESVLESSDGSRPFSGTATIDVKLSGQGLSPAALLADLNGDGAFQVVGAKLTGISPEQFTRNINNVRDAATLQAAFASMREGQGLNFAPIFGAVSIRRGLATITPFNLSTPDAAAIVSPVVDLVEGVVSISTTLDLKAQAALPRMSVTYMGKPGSLTRREDITELSAHLGFKVLQQGVDELEKVQAEQERLAREEEEMRKADQLRLEQFYAQRAELRLRQRELRTFQAQRLIDAEFEKKRSAMLIAAGRQISREELARRLRELAVFGRPFAPTANVPPVLPRVKPKLPESQSETAEPLP